MGSKNDGLLVAGAGIAGKIALAVAITQGYGELAVSVSSADAEGYNFYDGDVSEWVHIRDGRLYVVKATAGEDAARERREGE